MNGDKGQRFPSMIKDMTWILARELDLSFSWEIEQKVLGKKITSNPFIIKQV